MSAEGFIKVVETRESPYILVSFYRSDCRLCSEEMPDLIQLQEQPQDGVSVILVSIDEANYEPKTTRFLENHDVDFPTYHLDLEAAQRFILSRYPQWDGSTPLNMIFTQEGALVEVTGMTDRKEVRLIVHEHQTFR